jgi:carboxylesterase type B
VHGAWASFVIDGVPAHPGLPTWPVHGPNRAIMLLDETSHVVADPAASSRAIWDGVSF